MTSEPTDDDFDPGKLSPAARRRAKEFLGSQGRNIDRALFNYLFASGAKEDVWEALLTYRNPDGGFGHALHPDVRTTLSSVLATNIALQILRDVETPEDNFLVTGALEFVFASFDPDLERWPLVPKAAIEAPIAPWWEPDADMARTPGFIAHGGVEVLGHAWCYPKVAPKEFLELMTGTALEYLAAQPDVMEWPDLMAYNALITASFFPHSDKELIVGKLQRSAQFVVERDPDEWTNYCARPLWLAPTPAHPIAPVLEEETSSQLAYEIIHQGEDGGWSPGWSWFEVNPEAWQQAEKDWRGWLTLQTLRSLRAYGRIDLNAPE